jgi:hypothetical protein
MLMGWVVMSLMGGVLIWVLFGWVKTGFGAKLGWGWHWFC